MSRVFPQRMVDRVACVLALVLAAASSAGAQDGGLPVTFSTNFQGGSIGKIEKLAPSRFRCFVRGQHDERGRNRQASWYYFRMDQVRGRDLTLTLTDLVGEYNDKPGACPAGSDIIPVFSEDGGRTWRHFADSACSWDDVKKEVTLAFRPGADSLVIAHVPPYTPADLGRLLADVGRLPFVAVEVIGSTAGGRDLHLVTVTDPQVPDAGKKSLWLQARQHAWEAGTSYVAEGALRFLASDDPQARELRRRVIFRCTPMVDVDGCLAGGVRFNANGYDLNRHWDRVDLRRPELLRQIPETWYTKKAIVAATRGGKIEGRERGIDLLVNMHNTETAEYLETHAQDAASVAAIRRLSDLLAARTSFDPSRELAVRKEPTSTTNALSRQHGVPVVLMEQRIGTSRKLGRRPTVEDRLSFGRDLVRTMAEAVE